MSVPLVLITVPLMPPVPTSQEASPVPVTRNTVGMGSHVKVFHLSYYDLIVTQLLFLRY